MELLHHKLFTVEEIGSAHRERMFQLMSENYDNMNPNIFYKDLNNKQLAGLFFDENEELQGFTTYVVNPKSSGGVDYHIVFSGDTIISPMHWGSQIMVKGWCYTIGQIIATDPTKKWYWYLMSKGHRTYMYLPLFYSDYFPSIKPSLHDDELRRIVAEVSAKLYPKYWLPAEGIIRFEESMGELKAALVEGTYQKKNKPHVAFFLEKNPGFYRGEELVCLAPLYPGNFNRSAKSFIEAGMQHPLNPKLINLESLAF